MAILTPRWRTEPEFEMVKAELINAAQARAGLRNYNAVWTIMGVQPGHYARKESGYLLGEICDDEHDRGRPMLGALVVDAGGLPGDGFFKLARDLGRLKGMTLSDERAFWEREVEAIYETWDPDNVRKRACGLQWIYGVRLRRVG